MPVRRAWTFVATLVRRIDIALLLVVLAVSGAAWVVAALADEVSDGETHRLDTAVLVACRDAQGLPLGPHWLEIAMRDITALGGPVVLVLMVGVIATFVALRRAWGALVLVVVAPMSGLLLSLLLKSIIDRPRPTVVPHLMPEASTSFPSGHSLMSAVVYATLGALLARFVDTPLLKAYCIVVALLLTLLIGASRVYLGVHWPTDVLAGWCAGLGWAALCWFVARWLQHRGQVERTVETPSP